MFDHACERGNLGIKSPLENNRNGGHHGITNKQTMFLQGSCTTQSAAALSQIDFFTEDRNNVLYNFKSFQSTYDGILNELSRWAKTR